MAQGNLQIDNFLVSNNYFDSSKSVTNILQHKILNVSLTTRNYTLQVVENIFKPLGTMGVYMHLQRVHIEIVFGTNDKEK